MTIKKKHLGKGLQALLGPIPLEKEEVEQLLSDPRSDPKYSTDKALDEYILSVDLSSITPNPYQPRTVFNEDKLHELADSIAANGLIQPIILRKARQGYHIIAGERRFRAANIAGLNKITAIVRNATDEQMLELALVENIHRDNLNCLERAKAYKNYIESFSLTQQQAAQRLGENRSVIANYMRLLDLPLDIRDMLTKEKLSMGHARALLALASDELRRKLANRAMANRLSVRAVEKLVKKYITELEEGVKTKVKEKLPNIRDLENSISSKLATKVNIDTRKGGKRGKITIEFYSLDDFDRICEQLGVNAMQQV
jgi:ParB family chromosome partitioning protein